MRLIPLGDLVECDGHAAKPAGPSRANAEKAIPSGYPGQSQPGNNPVTDGEFVIPAGVGASRLAFLARRGGLDHNAGRGMGRMSWIRMGGWLLALLALVALAAGAAEQEPSEAGLARAPVVVDGHVLAQVRGIAGRPAEDRAAVIEERIVAAARDSSIDLAQVHVEESEDVSRIQAGDSLLMGVFDADAALENMDRQALAQVQARVIRDTIERYRADRTPEKLVAATEWALIATAIFVAALIAVYLVTGRIARWMTATLRPRVLAMRTQALGFLPG